MIICVAGPTGSGKTSVSVKLAKKYNAIIVNADATQIYRELNIGSNKITEEEKCGVEHLLFDIKNPDEFYSVYDYQNDARDILDKYKDKNIIICGGTGLYIKALFYDYVFSEKDDNDYESLSNYELYNLAKEKDPNMEINLNNRVRLLNFVQNKDNPNKTDKQIYDVIYIGLTLPREKLYEKVNIRVDEIFNKGLVEEVKSLYAKYPNSPILSRAIGYKEIISYLNNEISLEEAKELIKKNTRHYVKRQYTWFNNQLKLNWFDPKDIDSIYEYIDSLNSK